jgi:alpha-tubulin suppressor-like RCC1 family protein
MKTITCVARIALLALASAFVLLLAACSPIALRTDLERTVRLATASLDTPVVAVSAGEYHTLLLEEDGTVWAAGRNNYGQLGTEDWDDRVSFVPVMFDVASIEAGLYSSFVIMQNGDLWGTGCNEDGELGLGDRTNRSGFVRLLGDVDKVSGGGWHTLVVRTNGSLWTTGRGDGAGRGDSSDFLTSFAQISVVADVIAVACGYTHSLALESDGDLWGAGTVSYGELGLGATVGSNVFTSLPVALPIHGIGAGDYHSLAFDTSAGTLYRTGYNSSGQLGMGAGDTGDRSAFAGSPAVSQVTAARGGGSHSIILKGDGTVWVTGSNYYGQLGIVTTPDTQIEQFTEVTDLGNTCAAVAAGGDQTFVLKNDGSVWVTGYNDYGELGTGDYTSYDTFIQLIP